jgi:hypothetical protein
VWSRGIGPEDAASLDAHDGHLVLHEALKMGWEPFAVTDDLYYAAKIIWLRRPSP